MAPIAPLSSDWDDVATYTDAAQNYRLGAMWLNEDIEGLDPESDLAIRAEEMIEDSQAWAKYYIEAGEKPIDALFYEGVREGLDETARCGGTSSGPRALRGATRSGRSPRRPSGSRRRSAGSSQSCSTRRAPHSAPTTTR